MKKREPELYADILAHVERHEIFTSQQIENYRKAIKQPKMSKSRAKEEMLADAFAASLIKFLLKIKVWLTSWRHSLKSYLTV